MTLAPIARRMLLLLALDDLVLMARDVVDRNRYGDGRPGAVVAELADMLDRLDRYGGLDVLWLDLWPSGITSPVGIALDGSTNERGSERLRTAQDSDVEASGQVLQTAEDGSGRVRTAVGKRSERR